MNATLVKVAFWITGALSLAPFLFQFVAWIRFRLRRIPLQRWRRLNRLWLRWGLTLLVVGAALYFLGPPEMLACALTALLGGLLTSIVALFQGRVAELLARPPRS